MKLHVLFLILKTVFIIILILLGLVVLLGLLVLLVPLRCRLHVRREGKGAQAEARITWLLRFVRAEADASLEGIGLKTYGLRFCIGPFTLKQFGKDEKKESKASKAPSSSGKAEEKPKEIVSEEVRRDKKPSESPDRRKSDFDSGNAAAERVKESKGSSESRSSSKNEEKKSADKAERENFEKHTESENGSSADRQGISDRVKRFREKVDAVITALPEKAADALTALMNRIFDTIEKFTDGIDRAEDATDGIADKFGRYFDDDARDVYIHVISVLKKMLSHFMPRYGKGYITFGTGMPDMTAWAGGLLYILLPAGDEGIVLTPVWDEAAFECDVVTGGHVRLIHGVTAAVKLLARKENRAFLRRLRRKEKKSGKSRSRR